MPPAAAAALCRRVTTTSVIIRTRPESRGSPNGRACASVEADLGRRQRAGAQLVLEPAHDDARRRPARVDALRGQRRVGGVPGDQERRQDAAALPAPSGRASATAIAESTAEQNHFSPVRRQAPPPESRAVVAERARSEPPGDSVIHCPLVTATAGSVLVSRGSHACRTAGSVSGRASSAAAPSAIATGQEKVADSGPYRCSSACWTTRARAPQAPRASGRYGRATTACRAAAARCASQPAEVSMRSTRAPHGVVPDQRRRVRLGVGVRGAQRPGDLGGQRGEPVLRPRRVRPAPRGGPARSAGAGRRCRDRAGAATGCTKRAMVGTLVGAGARRRAGQANGPRSPARWWRRHSTW